MYRILFSFLLVAAISSGINAQSVKGILEDETDNTPISNATIKLASAISSTSEFTSVSNSKGVFTFNDVPAGDYTLTATSIGYTTIAKIITVGNNATDLGIVKTSKSAKTLQAVIINGAPPPVKQNGDTLDYAASQFKVNPDATSEDLIKKMPGITVDKSGTVTAHGETVKKVTVDGRDFFGDDATATLRNLPAEVIDKIQVFDKLSDQAQLTGFDDGNTTKAINIVTKKDMRAGNFGRIYAGYGTDDRYSAGGNVSFFNNERRISLIGLFNNVNQQNFSSQDLLGVTSSGNRGGGGQRGGGGGGNYRGGGANNFSVGQQNGIAKTNAAGINYSDAWGKKIDVTGSYFFNNSNTSNNQTVSQQNIITEDSSNYYDEHSLSNSKNYNNRVNFRLNYKIDSNNSILVTSNLNFQTNNSINLINGTNYEDVNRLNEISETVNNLNSDFHGNNLSNLVLFRHAFAKRGRSISLGISNNLSDKVGENYLTAINKYYKLTTVTDSVQQLSNQGNHNRQYSFNLVYTEPVGKKGQLQANYNPSFSNNNADQETFNYDNGSSKYSLLDTSLSNKFDNTYNTQNTGITYRHGDRNNMISAGVSYQYSELKSNQVFPEVGKIDNTYSNFLANAFARFKLSSKSNLRLIYRSSVSAPSVTQLQNVINNSNQFYYSTGNPALQQQYTNNLIARYNYTNSLKSQSFFANIFLQNINDYIANATYTASKDSALSNTVILYKGSQISKPVNLDGYLSARSFFTFGMPLKFIKSNLNWNAGFSYAKVPGLLNNVNNISNTYNYNIGAVLSSNISEYVDFNLSYSANFNNVTNSIQPSLDNHYFTQSAGISANLLTKKGLFFNNDLTNEYYDGFSEGYNTNYWLWNIAIGQKFLKKQAGELKLSVFDLLKQNKSITRNVTASYIQDVQNQVLQQYFMLTFTYKLKTFGKGKPGNNNNREGDFRRFGGPGGGPPFGGGGHDGPSL